MQTFSPYLFYENQVLNVTPYKVECSAMLSFCFALVHTVLPWCLSLRLVTHTNAQLIYRAAWLSSVERSFLIPIFTRT